MQNVLPTPKLKLKWLAKNKSRYINKVNNAFRRVRGELIQFLNDYNGEIDVLIKYLAKCTETDDVMTFIGLLETVVKEAKENPKEPEARRARIICSYIIFRIHWLSNFTIQWTNVKVGCNKCHRIVRANFLFTDKLCPYCGSIIF